MGVAQQAIKGQITPLTNEVAALTARVAALENRPTLTEADWAILAKASGLVAEFEAMAGGATPNTPNEPVTITDVL